MSPAPDAKAERSQPWKSRIGTPGSSRASVAALLLLAAGPVLAISGNGRTDPGQRRRALRQSQFAVMDIFARNYAGADWSLVSADLEAHPADTGNAAVISIPLSLANVYLNRYEVGWNEADLLRAIELFEGVAESRDLWGGRDGSGSVVSYLDISLARLRAECDVGGYETWIDELWTTAMTITAEEADAVLQAALPCGATLSACVAQIAPVTGNETVLASRQALFATASSFLADDPRAAVWAENARSLAALFPSSECQDADTELALSQGALSYRLAGGATVLSDRAVNGKTGRVSIICSPFNTAYETAGPVDVVTPGDSLALAIRDSRVVAFLLTEQFLWQFPPGSQCEAEEAEDN